MQSQYSILRFVPNPLSGEALAIGLLLVQASGSYLRCSRRKLDMCAKLYRDAAPLLKIGINGLRALVDGELDEHQNLMLGTRKVQGNLLSRLAAYNNGVLQFSAPARLAQQFDEQSFLRLYAKMVDEKDAGAEVVKAAPRKGLRAFVHQHFREALDNRIDLGLTVHQEEIPNLYFDFTFDAAGYNGAVYVAKAIDFNTYKRPDAIQSQLAEYENIAKRLEEFARAKGIIGEGLYCLIADEYKGNNADIRALHRMVAQGAIPGVSVANSQELDYFTERVINSGAQRFSKLLAGETEA